MIVISGKMQQLLATAEKIAVSDLPVLITGETGTGKELLAEYIKKHSGRANKQFVRLNCAAFPETLLESELFGHEKGSFTGANTARKGLLEFADGGTVFLDEVGDLSPMSQVKLMRFLQDGSFRKIGGNEEFFSNVRVISATNQNLENGFRRDLYFRLAGVVLEIPPLRERQEDIMPISASVAGRFCQSAGRKFFGFTVAAQNVLKHYPWPGNVRELENIVRQAVLLANDKRVDVDHLLVYGKPALNESVNFGNLNLAENEKRIVRAAMRKAGGVQKDAAKLLGISPRAMSYKISKLKITDLNEDNE